MTFEVCKSLFDKVDETTATFVHGISSKCIIEITPVVTVALTLSFIGYGLLIMRGAVGMAATEFLGKALRIVIIVNIAMAGGIYQSDIAGFIRTLPDDLATSLIIDPSQGASAASLVDEAAGAGFGCAGEAFNKAGMFSFEGITYCLIAIIVLFMTVILTGVGVSFLLMAKIALSILAGLGPLFIVALIFPATERFFTLWLGQVVNYVLLVVLYAAVFGLMMTMYKGYMAEMKMDGLTNVACTVGGVGILSFSMLIILRQLPSMASSLAGGVALNFSSGLNLPHRQRQSSSETGATHRESQNSPVSANASSSSGQYQGAQPQSLSRFASYGYYKGNATKASRSD